MSHNLHVYKWLDDVVHHNIKIIISTIKQRVLNILMPETQSNNKYENY